VCSSKLLEIRQADVSKAAHKPPLATFRQNFTEPHLLRLNARCPEWFILQKQFAVPFCQPSFVTAS